MLWALGVYFGKQKEFHLEAFASCLAFCNGASRDMSTLSR